VIGYFPLLSKSATELVVGEDDSHLDFRARIHLAGRSKPARASTSRSSLAPAGSRIAKAYKRSAPP
ncbi:DUF2867 domain-containing protein, partial [Rhizobium ruizarguesonis]